jgi:hypothetical protein
MGKRFSFLLSVVLGLFLCLFFLLCYHYRLATDDFYFIWDVRNHGILKGVTSQYMEWCGRALATLAMDIFYKIFDVDHRPYSFLLVISLLFLFTGFYRNLRLLSDHLRLDLSFKVKALLSGCLCALLFFLSIDTGESWFWFCSYSTYLWSIIAFVWGIYFLFEKRYSLLCLAGACLCFAYVGNASEIYASIFGLLFTLFLVYRFRTSDKMEKRFVSAYAVLGISFIIFLIAPGNYLRDGLFPERHVLYSFFITAKSFVKFGALYLPFKLPYIVIFAFPFLVLGYNFRESRLPAGWSFKKFFWRSALFFTALLFIFFYLTAFVMVETGPPRVWFLVSFLLAIYCSALCFYAGYKLQLQPYHVKIAMYLSTMGGIILLSWQTLQQQSIASAYSAAIDARTEHLEELNTRIQKDTLILLEPLPPPGMLYSAEISKDTTHFSNRELRLGYDLKYHAAVNR